MAWTTVAGYIEAWIATGFRLPGCDPKGEPNPGLVAATADGAAVLYGGGCCEEWEGGRDDDDDEGELENVHFGKENISALGLVFDIWCVKSILLIKVQSVTLEFYITRFT